MAAIPNPTLRIAVALAFGLSLASLGCQGAGQQLEKVFYAEYLSLSFDRPSDLIPPERFRVSSTEERQIALAWEPVLVGDVAGYAITRARGTGGAHVLIGYTQSRFDSVFIDSGNGPERLGDGQTYSYRVHPFDSLGRVSRSHAHLTATTDPRPDPPDGLRAYSNLPRKVALAWEPHTGRSVVGYSIFRSPTLSGQWTDVGFADGRLNTVWEDPVNGDLRQMYYRIEAVNRFGATSEPSDVVRGVTKAEPLPPIGLEVRRTELGQITLGWDKNVERDLDRYEIWRAEASMSDAEPPDASSFGPERRIGASPARQTTFTDLQVGCGQAVQYRIRVIDRDQLVSGFSRPLRGVGETMNLRVEADTEGTLYLVWDEELLKTWPRAQIGESRPALPDRLLGTVDGIARYSLAGLAPGAHLLRVTLLDRPSAPEARPAESPTCSLRIEMAPSS